MEVVGSENLQAALDAGCPGHRMLFNGAAWNEAELSKAVFEIGITHFSLDSQPMAEHLAKVLRENSRKPKLHIALRLHDGKSHFGFHPRFLKKALETLPNEISPHWVCSSIPIPLARLDPRRKLVLTFSNAALELKSALSEGSFEFIDLGGGIDSPLYIALIRASLELFTIQKR